MGLLSVTVSGFPYSLALSESLTLSITLSITLPTRLSPILLSEEVLQVNTATLLAPLRQGVGLKYQDVLHPPVN